ncbi:MAG: hypothetical protein ACMUHX_07445 [bacterium]
MNHEAKKILFLIIVTCAVSIYLSIPSIADKEVSLLKITPDIMDYAIGTVKPVLDSYPKKDKLSLLLKVSDILIDPKTGINVNKINPSDLILFDKFNKLKIGFLITFRLPSEKKQIIKSWHSKFMQENPADVFFALSADEIIRTKTAFGCTHYARAFISVVKALGLIDIPEDLRYVVSCKADDYNNALEKTDSQTTINGHQFVMVKIDSRWIAINTSKSESTAMPEGFSPESVRPPQNIPVRFDSYPDVTFLLRKIGKNYNDDCDDNSLSSLMNISRSGDSQGSDFRWSKFFNTK